MSISDNRRDMIDRTAARLLALTGLLSGAGFSQADGVPAQTLMHEHKCYVCHADNDALAGPAFVDVAARFRGNPQAVALIATFVRRGEHGGGLWHMPPHPEVSPQEAAAIARYILSLDAAHTNTSPAAPPSIDPATNATSRR